MKNFLKKLIRSSSKSTVVEIKVGDTSLKEIVGGRYTFYAHN